MSLMIVDPYRFAFSGPAGDVVTATGYFASGTTTGSQDVTSATLSGYTPKAALILSVTHDLATPSSETANFSFSFGAADSIREESIFSRSRDNRISTECGSGHDQSQSLNMDNGANSIIKAADVTPISEGMNFNFTTNLTYSAPVAYLAFAGADLSAKAEVVSLGTGTSALDVTSPGFQPDAVIFYSAGRNQNATTASLFRYSIGFATSDGTQMCVTGSELAGIAAGGTPLQAIVSDRGAVILNATTGAVDYSINVSDFDASGFSVTPSSTAGTNVLPFLALKTGRGCKIVEFTTPTSTGSANITGAGFTPQAAIVLLTNLEASTTIGSIGTLSTSDLQSGLAFSFISDDARAFSCRIDSGADPTDTASFSENVAILGASATSCNAIRATFTAWTSDGMTVNYTAVQGTGKKGIILFLE